MNRDCECLGKFQFGTQNAAARVLKKMKDSGKKNVYKCSACDHWHIGSILGHKHIVAKRRAK